MKTNKFYKLDFTEHNGEQSYSYAYLISAKTIKAAMKIARDFIKNWYEDGDGKWEDEDTCDYGGILQVVFDSLEEITPAQFAAELLNHYSIDIEFEPIADKSKTDFSIKIKT
jgi:hypothetical protein